MGRGWRRRRNGREGTLLALAMVVSLALPTTSLAQFAFTNRFELSEAVYLDLPDHAAYAHLEQLKTYVAGGEWSDALDVLGVLSESYGEQVLEVSPRRYLNIRDYCHLQIAALPKDVLARYRAGVDPQAEAWFRQGQANRQAAPLLRVVDELFCSSWGDDALFALSEMALERGEPGAARGYLNRLLPPADRVGGDPLAPQPGTMRLIYPDTTIAQAEINARLVLVSILAGQSDHAPGRERAGRLHAALPDSDGSRLWVAEQLSAPRCWPRWSRPAGEWPRPAAVMDHDWPTFCRYL